MRAFDAIGCLLLAAALTGCDGSRSSSLLAPSATPFVPAVPPARSQQIEGWLFDSAFRPMPGATAAVLSGPQAGTFATANDEGHVSLTGTFDATTTFRASAEGFVAATQTWTQPSRSGRPHLIFFLAAVALPAEIGGDYTLTFIVAPECHGFPDDVRRRAYIATVTPVSKANHPAHTLFDVSVGGGTFLPNHARFPAGVAGPDVVFELRGEGPTLVEQVAPTAYLGFDGRAEASLPSRASHISIPFQGRIDYCALSSPMGRYFDCRPDQAITAARCESNNHQLILTRQ